MDNTNTDNTNKVLRNKILLEKVRDDDKRDLMTERISYWKVENVFNPKTSDDISKLKQSIVITNMIREMIRIDYPMPEQLKKIIDELKKLEVLRL